MGSSGPPGRGWSCMEDLGCHLKEHVPWADWNPSRKQNVFPYWKPRQSLQSGCLGHRRCTENSWLLGQNLRFHFLIRLGTWVENLYHSLLQRYDHSQVPIRECSNGGTQSPELYSPTVTAGHTGPRAFEMWSIWVGRRYLNLHRFQRQIKNKTQNQSNINKQMSKESLAE